MNDINSNIENSAATSIYNLSMDKIGKIKDIDKIHKNLTIEEKNKYADAARGFESIFFNMMIKEMKSGLKNGSDGEGEGEDSFGGDTMLSYADTLLSDQISKTGSGIGIADKVYQFLTGEKIPVNSVITPASNAIPEKPLTNVSVQSIKSSFSPDLSENISGNFLDRVKTRLNNYDDLIQNASQTHNVPQSLIKAVITAESAGKLDAKSSAGAKGLMQLMDGTASDLGVNNSFDPEQNIMGGSKYLSQMLNKFNGDVNLALAAYNAGPGNVDKYNGVPPFKETQAYINRVLKYNNIYNNEN
jgi:Rod binding domain-containing protein